MTKEKKLHIILKWARNGSKLELLAHIDLLSYYLHELFFRVSTYTRTLIPEAKQEQISFYNPNAKAHKLVPSF